MEIDPDALEHLIAVCSGDARVLLNTLEFAAVTTTPDKDGVRRLTLAIVEEAAQAPRVNYDKSGDNHYDVISAFIKSMRGSDPDAALYWFARMLYANEDPRFIVRRIIVHASEERGWQIPMPCLQSCCCQRPGVAGHAWPAFPSPKQLSMGHGPKAIL